MGSFSQIIHFSSFFLFCLFVCRDSEKAACNQIGSWTACKYCLFNLHWKTIIVFNATSHLKKKSVEILLLNKWECHYFPCRIFLLTFLKREIAGNLILNIHELSFKFWRSKIIIIIITSKKKKKSLMHSKSSIEILR